MASGTFHTRRGELETYFDRTAVEAWSRLTSDAPVSGIRATVRAGREEMRATLLGWLPTDLGGRRVLDAGCGTGALAVEAARRGAEVVAVDVAAKLIALARERAPADLGGGRIDFRTGDFTDPALGRFDHVVAMDSFVHYRLDDVVGVLGELAARTEASVVFTFAPRTPALAAMHAAGKFFPKGDRAPAIQPAPERRLFARLADAPALAEWRRARTRRIQRGFYTSEAVEVTRL
ncbi:MAG: magnesium protoporphyrin IX methyltransferase [Alphaproteobacteria bacterium]|jgi:magnesium-protoporphyrin O-methyltransferase|nr:magnesium protoporphyrin IX methyltransferase [Alphaproteobacteria bacterium]